MNCRSAFPTALIVVEIFNQMWTGVDERIGVRGEPAVVDPGSVVVFEFALQREPVWFVQSRDRVRVIPLEPGEIVRSSPYLRTTIKLFIKISMSIRR